MNFETVITNFAHISAASVLIPFLLLIFKYKAFNKTLKALFIYVCSSIISELLGLLSLEFPQLGIPISYSFALLEFSIIAYLFFYEFEKTSIKKYIQYLIIIFFTISFGIWCISQKLELAEEVTSPLEFALIIILSITYFYKIFIELSIPHLTNHPFFWFNSAFLLYFGTNFLIFLFHNYVQVSSKNVISLMGCLHLLMCIIYNIMLSIGICKVKRV